LVALLLGHLEQRLVVVTLALVAFGFLLPYRSFFLRDLKLLLQFRDVGLEGRDSGCEVLSSAYLGTQRGGCAFSASQSIDVLEDRKEPRGQRSPCDTLG